MINLGSAMYIIAWITLPFMSIGIEYRLLAMVAAVLWCCTIRTINPEIYKKARNVIIMGAFYCFITFIGTYMIFDSIPKAISDTINPMIVVLIFLFCYGYYGKKQFKIIVYFTLACFIYVGIISLQQLAIDPRAARDAYASWMEGKNSAYTEIGTYGFVLSSALICLPMIVVAFSKKIEMKTKILFLATAGILVSLVFQAGYTIAVIAMLVTMIVYVCIKKMTLRKKFILLLVLALVTMFGKTLLEVILEYLIKVTSNNEVYNERMKELYDNWILGLTAQGDLAARYKRYTATLNEIWDNPILGAAVWKGKYNGGGHSEYLDAIGKFGWIYFGCSIWITLIKPIKNLYQERTKALCWGMASGILVLCVFDTYSYVQMLVTAVILPYVVWLLMHGEEKRRPRKSKQ